MNDFIELRNILLKIWKSFSLWLKLCYIGLFGITISLIGYGMRYLIEK